MEGVCVIACMVVYGWQKYALSVEDVRNNCKRVGTTHTTFTKAEKMNRRTKQKLEQLKKLTKEELMILYYAKKQQSACEWHEYERNIFAKCAERRPSRCKVQNRFSRIEAGVGGMYTRSVRTGSYTTCVCKSRSLY